MKQTEEVNAKDGVLSSSLAKKKKKKIVSVKLKKNFWKAFVLLAREFGIFPTRNLDLQRIY